MSIWFGACAAIGVAAFLWLVLRLARHRQEAFYGTNDRPSDPPDYHARIRADVARAAVRVGRPVLGTRRADGGWDIRPVDRRRGSGDPDGATPRRRASDFGSTGLDLPAALYPSLSAYDPAVPLVQPPPDLDDET